MPSGETQRGNFVFNRPITFEDIRSIMLISTAETSGLQNGALDLLIHFSWYGYHEITATHTWSRYVFYQDRLHKSETILEI